MVQILNLLRKWYCFWMIIHFRHRRNRIWWERYVDNFIQHSEWLNFFLDGYFLFCLQWNGRTHEFILPRQKKLRLTVTTVLLYVSCVSSECTVWRFEIFLKIILSCITLGNLNKNYKTTNMKIKMVDIDFGWIIILNTIAGKLHKLLRKSKQKKIRV